MNPLDQLRDIHLPEPVSAWPPAYGWWLLTLGIIGLIGAMIYVSIRHYRYYHAKREALKLLEQLDQHSHDWHSQLNAIIKRTCLSYFPHDNIAQLYGEQWLQYLASKLPKNKRSEFITVMQPWQQSLYAQKAVQLDGNNGNTKENTEFSSCRHQALLWLTKANYKSGQTALTDNQPSTGVNHV